ncbi:hypothetical protein ABUW04_06905 [Streptacidiphilus sp. N1-10]|uniref:WD40 repeat protein n=1 Tax=Streptacidiphilus jeojiensis TaxID=3229225 RepID=A0ABV6XJ79_9ACTN
MFDQRSEALRDWIDATAPDQGPGSVKAAGHAYLLGRALSAPKDRIGEHDEALTRLMDAWRQSGMTSAHATAGPARASGRGLGGLSPRVAEGLSGVLDRIEDLHSTGGSVGSTGPERILVIAALLMSGAGLRRRPLVRVPVVFGHSSQPGHAIVEQGTTGVLELREFPAGPAGLYPDPRAMAGTSSASGHFAESVGHAWNLARPRGEGRCVLWRIVLSDDPLPPQRIDGPSLGAAFALGLRELLRYPRDSRPNLAQVRGTFYGLRPRTAVTGEIDGGERLLKVSDMDAKLLAARRKGMRLVAPAANRLDIAPAPGSGNVRFAETLKQADRYARRFRTGRLAIAALVLGAIASGAFALQQQDSARSEQRAALVGRIAAEANQLRSADPSLAARFDVSAYQLEPTADLYTQLIADANSPLSTVLNGYSGGVRAVAFSPDGHTIAAVGNDADGSSTVRLWNVTSPAGSVPIGQPLRHLNGAYSLAFSPDGRILATGGMSTGDTVRLWNVADPAHPLALGQPLRHTSAGGSVVFSPDGRILATGTDHLGDEQLWNVIDPAHPAPIGRPLHHAAPVDDVAFSPNDRSLATIDGSATVRLWNVADPGHAVPFGQITTVQTGDAQSLAFSPDGRTLATGGLDHAVRLWNTADPTHPVLLGPPLTGHTGAITSMAFGPDGHTLATASSDDTVRLWNVTNPARPAPLTHPLTGHTGAVSSVAFSPDGRALATSGDDHTVRLWTLPAALMTGHTDVVDATVFRPDGRVLATASTDHTVRLWNIADPAHPTSIGRLGDFADTVYSMAFSPDGRTLATSVLAENRVELWNVSNPAHPAALVRLENFPSNVDSVAFSPDGHTLATATSTAVVGRDNSVRLWNVTDPARPALLGQPLTGNSSPISSVEFSPDSRTLAISGAYPSDAVRLWDVTTPARPVPFGRSLPGGASSVVFSPDDRTIATITTAGRAGAPGDGTVKLWDVSDRTNPIPLGQPLSGYPSPVTAVAFDPDGHTLVTIGSDVRLWNVTDPARPASIGQPLGIYVDEVGSVTFSPYGNAVATGGYDGTVRLWQLGADQAAQQICDTTGTPTRQQWQQYLAGIPYRASCG